MNCETYRKLILLEDSGELGWFGRYRVRHHLRVCNGCREFQADLAKLETAAWSGLPSPAPELTSAVTRSLQTSLVTRRPRLRVRGESPSFAPALAYATLSVVVLAVFLFVMRPYMKAPSPQTVAERGQDAQSHVAADTRMERHTYRASLDDLTDEIALTWLEWYDSFYVSSWEHTEAIARELLELEGVQI